MILIKRGHYNSCNIKMLYINTKNNSNKLKKELVELENKNKLLFDLINNLSYWINSNFKKNTIITMIYRTKEQQDSLYSHSDKYKNKPWKSPHQFWHALDLRSFIYTKDELKEIVNYLNNKYNSTNYYKFTAMVHEVGNNGIHFHIQYYKK